MSDIELKSAFEGDLNADIVTMKLSAYRQDFKFVPNQTVIIFDEIQQCLNARTAVKFLVEDGGFEYE